MIAIVGSSKLTENEERDVRQTVSYILDRFTNNIEIISGGANGVDSIAVEIAKSRGLRTQEYLPSSNDWVGYSLRNIQIAKECDELFCITTPVHDKKCYHHTPEQDHQKTAGCWTMNQVLNLHKPCRLLVTPSRMTIDGEC